MSRTFKLQTILGAIFDPLSIVTLLTTLGLITGVLTYFAPVGQPVRLWVKALCIAIAVLGLAAIVYNVRNIYRRKVVRILLGKHIEEGLSYVRDTSIDPGVEHKHALKVWCQEVEATLMSYLDSSYVTRFRIHWIRTRHDKEYMEMQEIRERVRELEKFLIEIA